MVEGGLNPDLSLVAGPKKLQNLGGKTRVPRGEYDFEYDKAGRKEGLDGKTTQSY